MDNNNNLRSLGSLPREELREISKRAGVASGEARRKKKALREGIKAVISDGVPDQIREEFAKAGYDVESNLDAVIASIIIGAIKGNPQMIDRIIRLIGEDDMTNARKAEVSIAKARLQIQREKEARNTERQRILMESVNARANMQMEDDGFIEALKGTSKEDWSEE